MNAMKKNETTLIVVLICVMVIMVWMFAIYAPMRTQIQFTESMISRQLNRIETRATAPEPPKVSMKKLQEQLDAAVAERDALTQRLTGAEARFVSLETVEGIRQLRFDIASIAESTGLDVKNFGAVSEDGTISDGIEALNAQIRAPWGRPVLAFAATGSFGQMRAFIARLGMMKQSAAVVRLVIKAPDFAAIAEHPETAGLLSISMDLAL